MDSVKEFDIDQVRKEQLEHRDVLLAIASLMKTVEGRRLFKYLFKNLDATKTPEFGMEGNVLHDYLGFLRAGNSIYKLACEADSDTAAQLIAQLERDRYADIRHREQLEEQERRKYREQLS